MQNRFDLPAVAGTAGSGALLDASHNTDTVAQAVTRGSLVYGNTTPKWDELVIGAANRLLRSDGTDVSWAQAALATDVSGVLPVANGGTNSSAALSGSTIAISNGSALVQGAAGTTTTVLHGNAAGAPTYAAVALTTDVTGVLPVANGGTGSSTAGITVVTKNLTDAELKALFTTPITVLAAPGANKVNWPIGLCIRTTVTGLGLDEPLYSLRYVGTTAQIFTTTKARFASSGVGIGIVDLNALEYSPATAADAVNKAIEVLFDFNPSGAGLAATATVRLLYQTIDTV